MRDLSADDVVKAGGMVIAWQSAAIKAYVADGGTADSAGGEIT
jgi:hypothetical protein